VGVHAIDGVEVGTRHTCGLSGSSCGVGGW
jgi:hypothetical protein